MAKTVMAFDQATRNRLQRFVTDARSELEEEFTRQLQNDFGLDPKSGAIADLAILQHIDDAQRETARILRETLAHYISGDDTDAELGLNRIVREQAFTVLNRLAALRMAEARGLLIESVGNGYQAKGFQLYARIAGSGLGETADSYRTYIFSVFDELSQDLPGLFDRFASQGRLFPREAALLRVLSLINDVELDDIWADDETIGWIYQYFNSKEERTAMREASQAPRNSRELAVRNQFFTPRYVVEFLLDNTLGRLWYDDSGGQTSLLTKCKYLRVNTDEVSKPVTKLRDPRSLKLFDPACGSMHFGLYAFDLLVEIYREAWAWEEAHGRGSLIVSNDPQDTLVPLSQIYADESRYIRDIPRMIIENNIFGVDIDARAAQIASLALWLRAQRWWQDQGVAATNRPSIGSGQVIAAVAAPQELDLREQISNNLTNRDSELFERTLQLLGDLPEMGILLKIEQEIPRLIRHIFGEHGSLFSESDSKNWHAAEQRLRRALSEFARTAESTYRGRLFAQDALTALKMIDLCHQKFDVIVMNPPFGETSSRTSGAIKSSFSRHSNNLICSFIERAMQLLADDGRCGAVIDRTVLIKNSYQKFRSEILLKNKTLELVSDLGWGVLDANVEVSAAVLSKGKYTSEFAGGVNVSDKPDKAEALQFALAKTVELSHRALQDQPFSVVNFQLPQFLRVALQEGQSLSSIGIQFYNGHTIKSDVFKRLFWELDPSSIANNRAKRMWNGSTYSPFYVPFQECVLIEGYAGGLHNHSSTIIRSPKQHFQAGLCYGKRGDFLDAQLLPPEFMLTNEGFGAPTEQGDLAWYVLGLINSLVVQAGINYYCGQHKGVGYVNAFPISIVDDPLKSKIVDTSKQIYSEIRTSSMSLETDPWFSRPALAFQRDDWVDNYSKSGENVDRLIGELDHLSASAYGLKQDEIDNMSATATNRPAVFPILDVDWNSKSSISKFWAHSAVSFLVGSIYGRWDIRTASGDFPASEVDAVSPVPVNQPASLNQRSATNGVQIDLPGGYPLEIEWRGVLVDDPGHPQDIVEGFRNSLSLVWGSRASEIELEIITALEVPNIRSYFSNQNAFFADHLAMYSKGRRLAPIYWPVSSKSGSVTLWFYYGRLNDQTLYTAINDFLEPKLALVNSEMLALRAKTTKRSPDEESDLATLQSLESELIEFRDDLLVLAPYYKPNSDDGVQVTAAPLWSHFRHNRWKTLLKDTWTKFENGEYDWSHMAMNFSQNRGN